MAEAKAASSKSGPTAATRPNRLPAPTLFVGPPSRNASQLSLSKQMAESSTSRQTNAPLNRQQSYLRPSDALPTSSEQSSSINPSVQLRRPSDRSLETKWREMQNTLNEVELTAQSTTHVFSDKHAAALDELRRTQVELAKAWSRGSDEATPVSRQDDKTASAVAAQKGSNEAFTAGQRKRGDTGASTSTQLSGESEASSNTIRSGRSYIEDDAAEDVRLANERRVANEAYFKQVDKSVKDVVKKLDAVADAMRGVEGESRSLWSADSISGRSEASRIAPG